MLVPPFALAALLALASPAPHVAQTIHIKDFMFEPASVTIRTGETVTFVNDDDEAHTVTASDKSFDSEGLDSKLTWTHTFAKAGTFAYFCELHPYMKATIVVLAAKTPAAR